MQDESPLTLADVADILVGDNELRLATASHLAVFFRQDPQLASMREKLSDLARDAGLAPEVDNYREALLLHEKLDRLLAADDWLNPAEVLNRTTEGLSLTKLLHIIGVRAARPGAPAEDLASVRQRLESTREAERLALIHLGEAAVAAPWVVEDWIRENYPQLRARPQPSQHPATADWVEDFLQPVAGSRPSETPSLAEGGSDARA